MSMKWDTQLQVIRGPAGLSSPSGTCGDYEQGKTGYRLFRRGKRKT